MAQKGSSAPLNDPRVRKPNLVLDQILDGECDYSKYKTEPAAAETETISALATGNQRQPIARTTNIIVDEYLEGFTGQRKKPAKVASGRVHTSPSAEVANQSSESEQAGQSLKTSSSQTKIRVSSTVKVQAIEQQIFPPASEPAPPPAVNMEKGAATTRTPNKLVDDILDNFSGRKFQRGAASGSKQIEKKATPSKEESLIEKPNLRTALNFFRLVLKKKVLGTNSFAFNRLLLSKQKIKLLGHKFSTLASIFNHIKARRVGQGFNSILACGLKRRIVREPMTPEPERSISSSVRIVRTSKNRNDRSGGASLGGEDSQLMTKEDGNKLMVLSEEARQAIKKMQRFDRYIYPFESEKILKVPIEVELRRLQKIRGANKWMWNTDYDNQLIITCLYNHMKNLYELNRDLSQIDLLKVQNQQLQKRIIETNVQKQKELKEARASNPDKGGVNTTILNEYKSNTQFLITSLNETNEKARKLLQNQLKKANSPHKQLLQVTLDMVNQLIQLQEIPNDSVTIQTALTKLIEEQVDSTRTIQHLDRQRKTFEKAIAEAKTDEAKNMNQSLINVCVYLISLHSKLKVLKGEGSIKNFDNPQKLKSDLQIERNKIRELQAKILMLNKEKKALQDTKDITVVTTWETELTTIIEKIQKKQPYQADISKQRKLIAARKDNKFNGIICVNLNLLEIFSKKEKQLQRLERATQDKRPEVGPAKVLEDRLAKQKQLRENMQAELTRIRQQLLDYQAKEKNRDKDSQPLQNELSELFKICTLLEQVLTKRDSEVGTGTNTTSTELQKIRKTLQTRKKFSPTLLQAITIIESLMKVILDTESIDKKRQQEQERFQLQRTKELSGLDGLTKIFMKMIEAENVRVDDGLLHRLRKNIETTNTKLEKGIDSPVSDLYDFYRNFVEVESRLIALLDSTYREAKQAREGSQKQLTPTKKQQQSQNRRVQQLEKQLEVERGRFTTREAQINRLQTQEDSLNRRIQQLQKQLEVQKGRFTMKQQQLTNRDQELKTLKEQIKNVKNQLSSRDQELKNVKAEAIKKNPETEKQIKNLKELNSKCEQTEKNLRKRIGELERSQGDLKRQSNEQGKQISELNKTIADLQRQVKLAGDHKARLRELTQQLSESNKQNRDLNSQINQANRTIGDMKRKEEQVNKSTSQQQPYIDRLTEENAQLKRTIDQNNANIRDLNTRESKLNQKIRELNENENKLTQQMRDLVRDLESANRTVKQKTEQADKFKTQSQTEQTTQVQRAKQQTQKTKDEVQRTKDEVQKLKDQVKRNQDQITKSKQELLRSKNQIQQLKNDLNNSRDETQKLLNQIQHLKNDNQKSHNSINQLQNSNSSLESRILLLTQTASNIKFYQQANRSLKDENDILRDELLARRKGIQKLEEADVSKTQQFSAELNQLRDDYNRLRAEHDRVKDLLSEKSKDSEIVTRLTNENLDLKNIINSNQVVFHQVVRDNEIFLNDINILKANEQHLHMIIQTLEAEKIAGFANLNPDFQALVEQNRLLQQQNTRLSNQQQNQQIMNTLTKEKALAENELTKKSQQLSDLKSKLDKIITDTSQNTQEQNSRLNKTIKDFESRENDLKKQLEANVKLFEQNEKKFNTEISALKMQLASKDSYQAELQRIKTTHVQKAIVEARDRQLSEKNTILLQLQREISEIKKTGPNTDRQLQEIRSSLSKSQVERNSFEQLFQQKKKDYDIILLELQNRTRSQNQYRERCEQLERNSQKLQKQLIDQQASWKSRVASMGTEGGSVNSRYMLVVEEKKLLQLEFNQLKIQLEKEFAFKRDIEEKFATMLQEKSKFIEKIDSLQKTVHAKELELLRNFELRQDSIREMINENKKLQSELRQINDKLGSENKISMKSLEENLSKLEGELSKVKKENTILRDEVEDLQDQLQERSRNRTPKRSSRLQRFNEESNEDKYMLKVEGEKLKDEIYYLQCSNERLKQKIRMIEDASVHSVRSGESRRRISSHMNLAEAYAGYGGRANDRLTDKVKYLERERHTLYQRLKILSIFSRIDTSNHAFIHNLNRVLDNILAFLNQSEEFSESIITYGNFISQITQSISSENYEKYFQNVEDFLKDLFMRIFENKNEILAKQAAQLIHFREQMSQLVNEQIDNIEEEQRITHKSSFERGYDPQVGQSDTSGMASFIALRHLFRLYVRGKNPDVLGEISRLLNLTEMQGAEAMFG